MSPVPSYSKLFSTLHDEAEPVGNLGRGTHYSVFRAAEWFDVERRPLVQAQIHDFAIVWDEDHDTRVISTVEQIYMAGMLSPVQFIGERKGQLTILVASRFRYLFGDTPFEDYERAIADLVRRSSHGDTWTTEVGVFERSETEVHEVEPRGLISAAHHRVVTYLRNIDSLWQLGTKQFDASPGTLPWETQTK